MHCGSRRNPGCTKGCACLDEVAKFAAVFALLKIAREIVVLVATADGSEQRRSFSVSSHEMRDTLP